MKIEVDLPEQANKQADLKTSLDIPDSQDLSTGVTNIIRSALRDVIYRNEKRRQASNIKKDVDVILDTLSINALSGTE